MTRSVKYRHGNFVVHSEDEIVEVVRPSTEVSILLQHILDINAAIVEQNAVIVKKYTAVVWEVRSQ